ncbi:hypothetical protein GCM10029992_42780 [Glycomyces albus]
MFALFGVGGVVGAFAARPLASLLGEGRIVWIALAVSAPALLLMPAAEPGWRVWLGAAGMGLTGLGAVVYNVNQLSFRQRLTPDRMLGRMNATVRCVVWGVNAIGALGGGLLGEQLGARATLWIAASAMCLSFLPTFFSPLRTMRTFPRPDESSVAERAEAT